MATGEDLSIQEHAPRPPALTPRRVALGIAGVLVALFWAWVAMRWYPSVRFATIGGPARLADLDSRLRDVKVLFREQNPYFLRPTLNDADPPFGTVASAPFLVAHGAGRTLLVFWAANVSLAVLIAAALYGAIGMRFMNGFVLAAAILAPLSVHLLFPVWSNQYWGQDEMFVATLVVVDLLMISIRRVGILTAIAACLEIVPFAFVVLLFDRGRVVLVRFAITAVIMVAVGFVIFPIASWHFWVLLLPTGQASIHDVHFLSTHSFGQSGNDSIFGMLSRRPFAHLGHTKLLFYPIALLVGVVGCVEAYVCQKRGATVLAIALIGITTCEINLVSWGHHWVWIVLLPYAALQIWRSRPVVAACCILVLPLAFTRKWSVLGALAQRGLPHAWVLSQNEAVVGGLLLMIPVFVSFVVPEIRAYWSSRHPSGPVAPNAPASIDV